MDNNEHRTAVLAELKKTLASDRTEVGQRLLGAGLSGDIHDAHPRIARAHRV
jgi:hypothetical protein